MKLNYFLRSRQNIQYHILHKMTATKYCYLKIKAISLSSLFTVVAFYANLAKQSWNEKTKYHYCALLSIFTDTKHVFNVGIAVWIKLTCLHTRDFSSRYCSILAPSIAPRLLKWMSMYFPKRLELSLRIVLALPKAEWIDKSDSEVTRKKHKTQTCQG